MVIIDLKEREDISGNVKLNRTYLQFGELLRLLRLRELPSNIIETLNQDIEEVNSTSLIDKHLRKLIRKKQLKILNLLEKELKLVHKTHYKNLWSGIGIAAFGIPIGFALSFIFRGNTALYGAGIPIGMVIGMVVGTNMDKKALEEGRQLDIEFK
ncbi:MAG: hypothetical protein FWG77_04275 [Treponema sp.]|nr:hypothetical protein [Treponema sp.]